MLASIRFLFAGSGSDTFSLSDSRTFSFFSPGIFCSSGPRVFPSYFSSCANSYLSGTRKVLFFNPSSHFIFSSAMPHFAFFSLFLNALLNDTFHPLLGILALLFCITPLARLSPCFHSREKTSVTEGSTWYVRIVSK